MSRWELLAVVAGVIAAAVVVTQAVTKVPGSAQRLRPSAPAPTPRPPPSVGDLSPEQQAAEERLLDEESFSHPVDVQAPEVAVVGPDGRRLELGPARGKVVLVSFWASWCPPCVAEMPSMLKLGQELQAAHPNRFRMVAVSGDETWSAVHGYFQKEFGGEPKFLELVRDPDTSAARSYYCAARGYCPDIKFPETYVIDRKGRIVAMMVGPRDWSKPEARKLLELLIRG